MVANLWDVTDRDIDRFCQSVLASWLGSPSHQPAKQGAQRPGKPPARAAAAGAVEAAHTESHEAQDGAAGSVSLAVGRSRSACKLPHLIGAAPVCYGLPTVVQTLPAAQ